MIGIGLFSWMLQRSVYFIQSFAFDEVDRIFLLVLV